MMLGGGRGVEIPVSQVDLPRSREDGLVACPPQRNLCVSRPAAHHERVGELVPKMGMVRRCSVEEDVLVQ